MARRELAGTRARQSLNVKKIPSPLWQFKMRYILNKPLMHAASVKTFLMQCDHLKSEPTKYPAIFDPRALGEQIIVYVV